MSVRPFRGHVHPMIPLVRALTAAGHVVRVASGDDLAAVVTGADLSWLPAGINPRQMPELFPDDDPDYGYRVLHAKVEDLLEIMVGSFRPDVVIRDPTDLAPIVAAELLGAHQVVFGFSHFIPKSSWGILEADRSLDQLRRAYGLPDDPDLEAVYRGLYLAVVPPSFEVEEPLPVPLVQRLRYEPWDGGDGLTAASVPGRTDRPTVLMTLGTVYNDSAELFDSYLGALVGEDVDVICTLGDGLDPTRMSVQADNIVYERYVPHSQLLPRCAAVLCHAGFNTMMGALNAGVPLVCIPIGSDQDYNAERVAALGLGLQLTEDEATPERIANAVRIVIADSSFRDRVIAFRDAMDTLPGLDAAIARIERLASDDPEP